MHILPVFRTSLVAEDRRFRLEVLEWLDVDPSGVLVVVACPIDTLDLSWMKDGELFVRNWRVKIQEVTCPHGPPYLKGEHIGLIVDGSQLTETMKQESDGAECKI